MGVMADAAGGRTPMSEGEEGDSDGSDVSNADADYRPAGPASTRKGGCQQPWY